MDDLHRLGDSNTRRFQQISKTYVFFKNNMGQSMKNTQSAEFCADRIDVIMNFCCYKECLYKEGSL